MLTWLTLLGCPKPDPTLVPTETDLPPTPTGDTDTDVPPPTPEPAPFGLDARPANDSCTAPESPPVQATNVQLTRVFDTVNLTNPVGFTQAPGDPDAWYVIQQNGVVKRFDATAAVPVATTVLQLTDIDSGGEKGLLGIAFAPDFAVSGDVYLSYTTDDGGLESRISRFSTSGNGAAWDLASEEILLEVSQPYGNHNGGWIEFGPDGMLYFGLGDGGSGGDPQNRAQDLSTLLGSLLRLDVSGSTAVAPSDNPFVDVPGASPEIFAYGFRNPWRWSFDRLTGEIWLGDVGQDLWEEVDRVEAGGNYGWRVREGAHCFNPDPCDPAGLIDPVVDYPQGPGRSVVGGRVYHGDAIPALQGVYLFSDFYDGNVWSVRYDTNGVPFMEVVVGSTLNITHYTEDAAGEMYVLDRMGGAIYRLDPQGTPPPDSFPRTLTATGCFGPDATPSSALIPYDLNHPFWSDGAEKHRWLALPDGTTIDVDADGDLQFPIGTVLIKEFQVDGVRTETRFFFRHADGSWGGYAYRWRADGTDADLVNGTTVFEQDDVRWTIPDRSTCAQCHTAAAGSSLGLELGQLARDQVYPSTNRTSPQLDTLAHIGLFTDPLPTTPPWPARDDASATLEDRARTYLHANCSSCHRPDGGALGELDLRRSTLLDQTGLCGPITQGDLGVTGVQVITPGDPSLSMVPLRMQDPGAYRMPPIATNVVDTEGVALIESWISAMTSCP